MTQLQTASPRTLADLTPWSVGPWEHREFAELRERLDPEETWPAAATLREATDRASILTPPEVILLAQRRPRDTRQPDIDRFQAASPLTRIVLVCGPWCEGERRSGRPPTGVVRLYWHELWTWWQEAMHRIASNACSPWSAPLDDPLAGSPWSAAELAVPNGRKRSSSDRRPSDVRGPSRGRTAHIAISSSDLATFESLEAALIAHGMTASWLARHRRLGENDSSPPSAGIWNGGQLDNPEQFELARFCREVHPAPVLALLDFPRCDQLTTAQTAGASAVIGKPYPVAALIHELQTLAAR